MKPKKLVSMLLAVFMVASFVACDKSSPVDTQERATVETVDSVETTEDTSRASVKDSLPDKLDFEGRTFTIFHSDKRLRAKYISGGEELSGEVVEDAAFNCNRKVEDRLNVKIDYVPDPTSDWDTVGAIITSIVLSGDQYIDFMMGEQYGICQLVTKGYFVNCFNLDYFDFDKPWWNSAFMDNMSIVSNKRMFIVGDYNLTMITDVNCLYFNKMIYENHFGDINGLYNEVFEGKWTIDRMSRLVREAYLDKNGNGQMDDEDQYGYIAYKAYATVDPYQYCGDVQYYTRDENGYIVIDLNQEKAVTLTEKVFELIHQTGTNTETIASINDLFMQNNALILHGNLSTSGSLREMKEDFVIIPIPKLDEEQKSYFSLVGDCALINAVPVSSDSTDIVGAVIEALNAETYRTVTPAYYDVALKNKYSRDATSARMIDLIHDTANTSFIYVYTIDLGDCGRLMRTLVNSASPNYASTVAKLQKNIDKSLERFINAVKELD